MIADDRNIMEGNCYCTTLRSEPCRYEADGKACRTRCTLFGKSLRMGRELQSLRCKECRAIPPGSPIPEAAK